MAQNRSACAWRRVAVCVTVVALVCTSLAAAASSCEWLKQARLGETSSYRLKAEWRPRDCPSGLIRYSVRNANGNTASFPSMYSPDLSFTPNPALSLETSSLQVVEIDVMCDGVTPLCDGAYVYVKVRPGTTQPPTETPSSTTSTATPTASPESPPVCGNLASIEAPVGVPTIMYPLARVENCKAPAKLVIATQSSPSLFTVSTDPTTGTPTLVFDAAGTNSAEGVYNASIRVVCSNANTSVANECSLSQTVVAKRTPTEQPTTPMAACSGGYSFRTVFNVRTTETINATDADAALCPVPVGTPRHFVFANTTVPRYNPGSFALTPSGAFTYLAPPGPAVAVDGFQVTISCAAGETATPGEVVYPLCSAYYGIRVTAAPPPTTPPVKDACRGVFTYAYPLSADGTFAAAPSSLAGRASIIKNDACPGNTYTAAAITSAPTRGTLEGFDTASGTFVYKPATMPTGPVEIQDTFTFDLTCAGDPSYVCAGTANVSITAAESDDTIHRIGSGMIVCKGTCDAYAMTRKDGRKVGTVDFNFTSAGKLLIHAYTTISNLQAQFVTFTPVEPKSSGFLTSAAAQHGSHVSFEPKCLDMQMTYGAASNVVTWSNTQEPVTNASLLKDVTLNKLTDNYRLGENYFQKFGGKHQHCDIFREDPCKLAPLLTPTSHDDNNNAKDNMTPPVEWRLFVNGCDATWVGEASVESLRALRQPDGSATFSLVSDAKLKGIVYMQTITPADVTAASKGYTTTTTAYELLVSIKNTVGVDAVAVTPQVPPMPTDMNITADIQFGIGRDLTTNERIYAYSILLYPSRTVNGALVSVNTTDVKLERQYLDRFSFTSPNNVECPACTGKKSTCTGTGNGYETDCGADGIVSFGPLDPSRMDYNRAPESPGGANLFPSTSFNKKTSLYNISFAIRANGRDSAEATDGFPVGFFVLMTTFSNGQRFSLTVNQSDYVSEINSHYLQPRLFRSSAYWPVGNAFGSSLPIAPFNGTSVSGLTYDKNGHLVVEEEKPTEEKPIYTAPARLTSAVKCALPATAAIPPHIDVHTFNTVVDGKAVSMCAVEEEHTYGVTDWFMLSFPSIHEDARPMPDSVMGVLIEDPTLASNTYTAAELQYIVLSLNASEATGIQVTNEETSSDMMNILLAGIHPPERDVTEEEQWMGSDPMFSTKYYHWSEYASFLNFRRMRLKHNATTASKTTTADPFNFAFIPGALLHSSSSPRVPMYVSLSIRFTTFTRTPATNSSAATITILSQDEEKLFYIISVSRATSAAMRFDSDAYTPKIVTVTVSGLGKKSATALLIVLLVAVAIVLAGAIYVEFTYRRIIHNAKYHPKRPDSAVGIRYGRDGQPIGGAGTESVGSNRGGGVTMSPSPGSGQPVSSMKKGGTGGLKTKFGVIGTEQTRVEDLGDKEAEPGKDGVAAAGGATGEERPPIGDEQQRVDDSEVASRL